MENPLANPFRSLVDDDGGQPERIWKLAGTGAGVVGGMAVSRLLDRLRTSRRSPDAEMGWAYALAWAGVVGIAAAVGRLLAQRVVATVWRRRRRPALAR